MTDNEVRTAAATRKVRRLAQDRKADALREAGWLVIPPEDQERAVALLNAIATDEFAHPDADRILLALVPPEVTAAYQRLAERASWWAAA